MLGPPTNAEPLSGPAHDAIRSALAHSAEFWPGLVVATGVDPLRRSRSLWELVWNGEVTNDAWAPLRAKRRYGVPAAERRPRRFSRSRGSGEVATAGRWSLTGRLFERDRCRPARARGAPARAAGDRDPRRRPGRGDPRWIRRRVRGAEGARDSRLLPPRLLRRGARRSPVRAPGAVERLRELRDVDDDEPLVLAAADPAQPYGGVLPWPKRAAARAARVAGAHVVLLGGEAALYVERGGRSLLPLRDPDTDWLRPALAALVGVGSLRSRPPAFGRAIRRAAGRRERRTAACSSRRASSPGRDAPSCVPEDTPCPDVPVVDGVDRGGRADQRDGAVPPTAPPRFPCRTVATGVQPCCDYAWSAGRLRARRRAEPPSLLRPRTTSSRCRSRPRWPAARSFRDTASGPSRR